MAAVMRPTQADLRRVAAALDSQKFVWKPVFIVPSNVISVSTNTESESC
jgi:hypothetical protein